MQQLVRIGCAAGFGGDRADAALPIIDELARHAGPRFLLTMTIKVYADLLAHRGLKRDVAGSEI